MAGFPVAPSALSPSSFGSVLGPGATKTGQFTAKQSSPSDIVRAAPPAPAFPPSAPPPCGPAGATSYLIPPPSPGESSTPRTVPVCASTCWPAGLVDRTSYQTGHPIEYRGARAGVGGDRIAGLSEPSDPEERTPAASAGASAERTAVLARDAYSSPSVTRSVTADPLEAAEAGTPPCPAPAIAASPSVFSPAFDFSSVPLAPPADCPPAAAARSRSGVRAMAM